MSSRIFPVDSNRPLLRIVAGEFAASDEPVVLQTLLGSCVAACLFDPVAKIGGMNHILLPGDDCPAITHSHPRYGMYAMELLVARMEELGAIRNRLQAKIFGGAHVISSVALEFGPGPRNISHVRDYLMRHSIPVIGYDTGGAMTRILHFVSDTFEIYVRKVQLTF